MLNFKEAPDPEVNCADFTDIQLRDAAIEPGRDKQMAWKEILKRTKPVLERTIRRMLFARGIPRDDSIIEDICESTWLRLTCRSCAKLRLWNRDRASLRSYVVMIGIGETLTWYRNRTSRRETPLHHGIAQLLEKTPDSALGPYHLARLNEAARMAKDWESNLSPLEKRILSLREKGWGQTDIARAMGLSQAMISKKLKHMQSCMDGLYRRFVKT